MVDRKIGNQEQGRARKGKGETRQGKVRVPRAGERRRGVCLARKRDFFFACFTGKGSILVKADKTREKPNRFLSGITVDFLVRIRYNKGS